VPISSQFFPAARHSMPELPRAANESLFCQVRTGVSSGQPQVTTLLDPLRVRLARKRLPSAENTGVALSAWPTGAGVPGSPTFQA
jgi:hypothetical protein